MGFDGFHGLPGLSDFVSPCQQDLELQEALNQICRFFVVWNVFFSVLQSHWYSFCLYFSSCSMLGWFVMCQWSPKQVVHSWSIWELGMEQRCLYWHVEVKFALLCAGDVIPRKKSKVWVKRSIYQGSGVKASIQVVWMLVWYTRWEGYRTKPSCKGKGWGWSTSSAVNSCEEKEADGDCSWGQWDLKFEEKQG